MRTISWKSLLFFLLGIGVMTGHAQAANGYACLPNGLNSFNALNPNVLSLTTITTDTTLFQKDAFDTLSTRCTNNRNVSLRVTLPTNNIFTVPSSGQYNILTNTAINMRVGYTINSTGASPFSTARTIYPLRINYNIKVKCAGGGLVLSTVGNQVIFDGVNNNACNGNFSVQYTVQIVQAGPSNLPSGYVTQIMNGLYANIDLYDASTGTVAKDNSGVNLSTNSLFTGSDSTVFQAAARCSTSLSSPTINFGPVNNIDVYFARLASRSFTINSNCTNEAAGGLSHSLYVYWLFTNVLNSDSSMLTNSDVSASAAGNLGVKIYCNSLLARHQENILLISAVASTNIATCTASLVPLPGLTSPAQITPGNFNATATLLFQIN